MTPARRAGSYWMLLTGMSLIATSGCTSSARQAQQIAHGKALFELHCMGCHNGRRLDLAKHPPNLNRVFQHAYLPSGRPATDDQVRSTILEGRSGIMPPFDETFSKQDINDIIRYLHTLEQQPQT